MLLFRVNISGFHFAKCFEQANKMFWDYYNNIKHNFRLAITALDFGFLPIKKNMNGKYKNKSIVDKYWDWIKVRQKWEGGGKRSFGIKLMIPKFTFSR